MTLRTRNKFYLTFFILSLTFLIASTAATVYLAINGQLHLADGVMNENRSVNAAVVAILLFPAYTTAVAGFICLRFEKTSSDEIVFFLIYLIFSFLEAIRLLYPDQEFALMLFRKLNVIYPSSGIPCTSMLLVGLSKTIVFSRSMAYLSVLCMPIFSVTKKFLSSEGLIGIITAVSWLTSSLCKVRVNEFQTNFTHAIANYGQFVWAILFVFAVTFLMIGNFLNFGMKKRIPEGLGYLGMIVGHLVMSHADSYITLSLSMGILMIGTVVYLKNVHSRLNS